MNEETKRTIKMIDETLKLIEMMPTIPDDEDEEKLNDAYLELQRIKIRLQRF